MALAVGIFVVALGIIVSEKVHRTKIALAGAVVWADAAPAEMPAAARMQIYRNTQPSCR